MYLFLGANVFFIALFVALAVLPSPVWLWLIFIAAWCGADYIVIKKSGIHLTKWQWGIFILLLTLIDVIVLFATGQI